MKKVLFIFLAFSASASAEILIRAPGASPKLYEEYLSRHLEHQSVIASLRSAQKASTEGEPELLTLSDRALGGAQELQSFMLQLRSSKIFSQLAWQFIADFLEAHRAEFKDFKKLEPLLCEALFYSGKELPSSCRWTTLSLDDLKAQWPEAEGLFIENKYFDLKGAVQIPLSTANQWRLVSNTAQTISFWGSFSEMQRRAQPLEYYVQGQCGEFAVQGDLPVFISASIYFSENCIMRWQDQPEIKTDSWYQRNRSWLIPVGAALVGGAAYSLKDKNIVFTKPSFK